MEEKNISKTSLNERVRRSLCDTTLDAINKAKKLYTDEQFPPQESSIGFEYSKSVEEENEEYLKTLSPFIQNKIRESELLQKKNSQFTFKRIQEIFPEFYVCRLPETYSKDGKDTLVNDILQGDLGDCYFLSVISAIAEFPNRIANLFSQKFKNPYGCYETKVNIEGDILTAIVDDYFPCVEVDQNEYKLAFTSVNPKSLNIWPLLLEKVWAKVNGSFNNIIEGCASQAFDFLTPAPVDILFHLEDNNVDLFAKIQDADKRNFIICCDTSEKPGGNYTAAAIESLGLITNHAYTVISAYVVINYLGEKVQLLKIRNPWGKLEWNGDWSDKSDKWTPALRKEVGLSDEDDGTFFMDFKDYFKFFSCSYICNYHDDYVFKGSHMTFDASNPHFFMYVDFKQDKSHAYIVVNLKNSKIYQNLTKDKEYQNPYCTLNVYKLEEKNGQKKLVFVGSNASRLDRIFVELTADVGRYLVNVSFPKNFKRYIIEYDDFKEAFSNYKDEFTFHVGIYANPSTIAEFQQISHDKVREMSNNFANLFYGCVLDRAIADKKKDHFYNENEVTTWRCLNFERETEAYGYLVYKNDSNALIKERITFTALTNIQIIPFIKQGQDKLHEEDAEIDFFEDRNEAKLISDLNDIVRYKSDYKLVLKDQTNKIGDNNPLVLEISIAPKSYYILSFEKFDEFAEIKCSSQIILKYELDFLLSERKFLEKKCRLKYRENFIDIFESVINHPAGVIFKYKNKTTKHKLEAKIYFDKHKNLEFNDAFADYFAAVQKEKSYETKLVKKEKSYVNLIVHPGQCMFVDFSILNDYEVFSYETKIEYLISIVGDFTHN